jgi:3-oxoacyl-[acyl-carrier-protein] synthase II
MTADGTGKFRIAPEDAGLSPGDVASVNAHATSTTLGDRLECRAIKEAVGEGVRGLAVSGSTEGMTGHLCDASGAITPTINHETHDLDCVPNVARDDGPPRPPGQLRLRRP